MYAAQLTCIGIFYASLLSIGFIVVLAGTSRVGGGVVLPGQEFQRHHLHCFTLLALCVVSFSGECHPSICF